MAVGTSDPDFLNPGHHATSLAGEQIRSVVWGGQPAYVSQDFGTYDPATASMYAYAAEVGWTAGTHVGLDVAIANGTPVYAAEDGTVTESHEDGSIADWFRPRPIRIESPAGYENIYGHLGRNVVDVGDRVAKGQLIGWSFEQTHDGTMDPDGTGPHIHFERRDPAGNAVNPVPLLAGSVTANPGAPFPDIPVIPPIDFPDIPGLENPSDITKEIYQATIGQLVAVMPRVGIFLLALLLIVAGIAFLFRNQIAGATPIGRAAKMAGVIK